ncbi:MAG: cytochrome ubiquinol oxidase subunit I [Armatimonadota bacterium]|nr:cytochrome ubiquinol oxidase subunit I [Armatimonadota bacterium]
METLALARWQFAITSVYHFFFVPLTLGLSILVAIMQTLYVRSGNPVYKSMTQFWGKLFLINFAMGVVTGIVMEFQFGMNWSEYSRFVGDVFGVALAIEALLAFFLEATFLGVWFFGWDRLSKRVHLASIWLVAAGVNLSALWILIANSFMHQPVGYTVRNGRAEMTDFLALVANPHVWLQFPHVLLGGVCTAAFFVLGISAWHLRRGNQVELFQRSFRLAVVYGLIGSVGVAGVGHAQAQHMVRVQPMKMAAAEALWESENPASFSLFSIINERERRDVFSIRLPYLLSLLAYNRPTGEVKGIKNLQAEYEQTYGPGNYVPPVAVSYWSFRLMVGAGFLMILLALLGGYAVWRKRVLEFGALLRFLPYAIALPYLANSTGWILTEIGRQPWIVFGLMKTEQAVSPNTTPAMVLASLIIFTLVYGALMAVDVYLLRKYATDVTALEEGRPVIVSSY